jgi:hypothetical protein
MNGASITTEPIVDEMAEWSLLKDLDFNPGTQEPETCQMTWVHNKQPCCSRKAEWRTIGHFLCEHDGASAVLCDPCKREDEAQDYIGWVCTGCGAAQVKISYERL